MLDPANHTFAICAYKESPHLEECIASIKRQETSSSCIMATSTPTEEIEHMSRKYGIRLYVRNGKPSIRDDWNFALDCALALEHKSLVTLAHQDDIYEPGYAKTMLECTAIAKRPLLFFSNYGEIRNGEQVDSNSILKLKRMMLSPFSVKAISESRAVRRLVLSLGTPISCPSVTYMLDNLDMPVFQSSLKCSIDWDTWERISRLKGSFVYSPEILMYHRIHEGSETSASIRDNTRQNEDLAMFERFWPRPIALLLNRLYGKSRDNNDTA